MRISSHFPPPPSALPIFLCSSLLPSLFLPSLPSFLSHPSFSLQLLPFLLSFLLSPFPLTLSSRQWVSVSTASNATQKNLSFLSFIPVTEPATVTDSEAFPSYFLLHFLLTGWIKKLGYNADWWLLEEPQGISGRLEEGNPPSHFAVFFFMECFPEGTSLWTWPPKALVGVAFLPFLTPALAWADSLLQGQGTGNTRQVPGPCWPRVDVCFLSLHPWFSLFPKSWEPC